MHEHHSEGSDPARSDYAHCELYKIQVRPHNSSIARLNRLQCQAGRLISGGDICLLSDRTWRLTASIWRSIAKHKFSPLNASRSQSQCIRLRPRQLPR